MPSVHAFLSASSAERWIKCSPSQQKNVQMEDRTSDFAKQGTEAHSLCEYKLHTLLGHEVEDPRPHMQFLDQEMEDATDGYVNFVSELIQEAKLQCSDPVVLIEQRVDYSKWAEGGFGTCDCLIVSDGTLRVVDFKYGQGIEVHANTGNEANSQLSCYALGALVIFDVLYDIEEISLNIYQPRRNNISSFTITKEQLLDWADNVLAPAAELAVKGEGEYQAGEHCTFCKFKQKCRARAEYNLELARYDFAMPDELEDKEIEAILTKVDALTSWANDIKDYALKLALSGKKWNDFKLVEGRSTRRFTNASVVAKVVKEAGYDPYETPKVKGLTAMTKLLGKSTFEELLASYVEKPKGKPTLVPKSDKRKEMDNIEEDFKQEEM